MSMTAVLENLYLGDIEAACDTNSLKKNNVTHLLTIDARPLGIAKHKYFTYKFICALDMAETDLLAHFEEAISFIESGREAGGIFVHW